MSKKPKKRAASAEENALKQLGKDQAAAAAKLGGGTAYAQKLAKHDTSSRTAARGMAALASGDASGVQTTANAGASSAQQQRAALSSVGNQQLGLSNAQASADASFASDNLRTAIAVTNSKDELDSAVAANIVGSFAPAADSVGEFGLGKTLSNSLGSAKKAYNTAYKASANWQARYNPSGFNGITGQPTHSVNLGNLTKTDRGVM